MATTKPSLNVRLDTRGRAVQTAATALLAAAASLVVDKTDDPDAIAQTARAFLSDAITDARS